MDEIITYTMCAVKVRNAKLRNYLNLEYLQIRANYFIFWPSIHICISKCTIKLLKNDSKQTSLHN